MTPSEIYQDDAEQDLEYLRKHAPDAASGLKASSHPVGAEPVNTKRKKRSDLGKDSLLLGLFCLVFAAFGFVLVFSEPRPTGEWGMTENIGIVLYVIAFFGALIGIVLAIIRLCQWPKRKLFCVLGLATNSLTIVLVVFSHNIAPYLIMAIHDLP